MPELPKPAIEYPRRHDPRTTLLNVPRRDSLQAAPRDLALCELLHRRARLRQPAEIQPQPFREPDAESGPLRFGRELPEYGAVHDGPQVPVQCRGRPRRFGQLSRLHPGPWLSPCCTHPSFLPGHADLPSTAAVTPWIHDSRNGSFRLSGG